MTLVDLRLKIKYCRFWLFLFMFILENFNSRNFRMLFSFFIIHPPLCKHEGDEISKILYYYPSTDSNERKLKIMVLN